MAKLRSDPITAGDLERYLGTDDDFAFELRCLHSLSERSITLEHGGTYSDPVTGKTRQFDIRANIAVDSLRVSLAIECKNLSLSYPLLVSRVPRLASEGFHHLLLQKEEPSSGGSFEIRIPRMQASESIAVESPNSVYKAGSSVGKSVTRVGIAAAAPNEFVADDAEVFDRWSQAVASAYGLISAANSYFWDDDADLCAYWIVPVLVVPKGTLWVADYDGKGSLQGTPKRADEVEIYLDHSSWQKGQTFSYTISHLHFVTPEGLLKLVDRIVTNVHFRKQILPEKLFSE